MPVTEKACLGLRYSYDANEAAPLEWPLANRLHFARDDDHLPGQHVEGIDCFPPKAGLFSISAYIQS